MLIIAQLQPIKPLGTFQLTQLFQCWVRGQRIYIFRKEGDLETKGTHVYEYAKKASQVTFLRPEPTLHPILQIIAFIVTHE